MDRLGPEQPRMRPPRGVSPPRAPAPARPRLSHRWIVTGVIALVVSGLIAIGLLVVYPRVGAWMIRDKLGGKVATRLGREVAVGSIDVSLGHAVLRDIEIRGKNDRSTPLVRIDRVDVDFDPWRSLIGSIRLGAAQVDGVSVTLRRGEGGIDNVSDLIERLRAERREKGGGGESGGGGVPMPTEITVSRARLLADDAVTSTTVLVAEGEARWTPAEVVAELRGITATSLAAPKAGAARIGVRKVSGGLPVVTVEGGEVSLYPKLSLTGIAGRVHPSDARAGEYVIDLAGGYGGVPGNLWTAKGGLDPKALTASIELEAAKFQLERLAPILARSPVVDYGSTSVDTKIRLELSGAGAKFAGDFHLRGLNVGHPMIAEKEVHDLDLSGKIDGSFDRATRHIELVQGDFVLRDVPFSITGSATARRAGVEAAAIAQAAAVAAAAAAAPGAPGTSVGAKPRKGPLSGPGGLTELKLRLVIPPIDCQRVLNAIPKEMAPHMDGYELRGVFDTDLQLAIDWADLDATVLDGHVGIKHCRVTKEPADSPKRLKEEFEHYVEYEAGKWMSFQVGDSNEDFVPLDDISPHLVNSIMSTEDSAFYSHHGFIPSEFRNALVSDLKAAKFSYGASSITMQMVRNVLLYREKTLARKLQELFLTWHVENTLKKDRILEIYFNVIEYGPALYGIGPAAHHYFGKSAKDLTPREAAFFSSILPNPKERYKQYCKGEVTKLTDDKINFYLGVMLKRKRLTQAEHDDAVQSQLRFYAESDETEENCLKRTQKAIKAARSTNPMKQSDAPPSKRPKPGKDKDRDRDKARDKARVRERDKDRDRDRDKDQDNDGPEKLERSDRSDRPEARDPS